MVHRKRSRITIPVLLCLSCLFLTAIVPLAEAAPRAVSDFTARDNPNDGGHAVRLEWLSSPDDDGSGLVTEYRLFRAAIHADQVTGAVFERVTVVNIAGTPGAAMTFTDVSEAEIENGVPFTYRIDTVGESETTSIHLAYNVTASGEWFDVSRIRMLLAVLILCSAIFYWIQKAQHPDSDIYLRPVAGLKAFDEAVGRATEMGQPVLFVPGIMDMDQIETLAGVNVLGYVANMTSRYETKLEVPVSRSLVMAHAREVVKESYLSSGRPDLYHDDMIHYITDDQFAYAAAVDGIMLREKPAACFYQGKFYAESLILAETGNSIGAIQIAGTASPAQLPFFITACDYTLIGEEFFAASAYLSKDKRLIGSIRGQDVGKLIFLIALVIGIAYTTLAAMGVPMPAVLDFSTLFDVSGG
jgi:hypothetical protein